MKIRALVFILVALLNPCNLFAQEAYTFDHTDYTYVLRDIVEDGLVNYTKLIHNKDNLSNYIDTIATLSPADLERMSSHEQIAFYINAYNAYTLQAIIDQYPVKSIRDIWGVWNWKKHIVAGKKVTLDHIDHKILRKVFNEPRVHFALVRAAISCPELYKKPYTGAKLDSQLKAQALKFINDPTRNHYNREENTLYVSSIFKWFHHDFGDIYTYITQYLSGQTQRLFPETAPVIKYKKYNWGLNESITQ